MKIAFDVDVIKDLGISGMVHQVAEWGYRYMSSRHIRRLTRFISTRAPVAK
ncbi:Uncharacterised protein [Raoultella terrigena]|uniref:Uncharacterized protein n=1 Tax=Raoultella terrigena TaxID=577 RepID=A0A4U9DBB8_RAOTE|nr:Uncharacterised protein [Raoultella terrigena]